MEEMVQFKLNTTHFEPTMEEMVQFKLNTTHF